MQTRRRSSHRAGAVGVTGLVTLGITGIMSLDVRRQRHLTALIQQTLNRFSIGAVGGKLHHPATGGRIIRQHRECDFGAINRELITRAHALGGPGQAKPASLSLWLQHQQLRQASTGTAHRQPRFEHPGVVHHQQITRLQFVQQIPDQAMTSRRLRGRNHEQARIVTRLHRRLSNPLRRQWVVVTAELLVPGIRHRHSDQRAKLSGRFSISSARSFRNAAASAP